MLYVADPNGATSRIDSRLKRFWIVTVMALGFGHRSALRLVPRFLAGAAHGIAPVRVRAALGEPVNSNDWNKQAQGEGRSF